MKATILDTKTGLKKTVLGPEAWEWAENDWSCDCNRDVWNNSKPSSDGWCVGCERFVVIECEFGPEDKDRYTLLELNAGYPIELLKKLGIAVNAASANSVGRATGIEAQVCRDIAKRQSRGIAKYGTTVLGNPLPLEQWLQHAYEESLDQAIYLKRAIYELKNKQQS